MQFFTAYGWLVCIWVLTISFQYGYHLSALNQLQAVLTCRQTNPSLPIATPTYFGLPTCIPMSDAMFSLVTSLFTVGGLCGSLCANVATGRCGRLGAVRISAALNTAGALLVALAPSIIPIAFGRFFVGMAAGIGVCIGPIYLAEITRPSLKGKIGIGTQLAIVIGIMVTQAVGLSLATPAHWRIVPLISAALSAVQYLSSPLMVESPVYLKQNGLLQQEKWVRRRLWGDHVCRHLEQEHPEEPLLAESAPPLPASEVKEMVTIFQVLVSPEFRRPVIVVILVMAMQQLSGINAVLYYSNAILSKALPTLAPYVSLTITVVNFLMTFPPIFLIEHLGRKMLICLSVIGAVVSQLAVGYSLNAGMVTLSSVAVTIFVMSFAIGLGPIPFVIIPEVAPSHVSSALSSVALSVSWILNFFVGLVFLELRNFLAHGDSMKEGGVFYVFAGVLLCTTLCFTRFYRG